MDRRVNMTGYAAAVFAACCIGGLLGLCFYKDGRAESLSLGIITLFIIVSPLAELRGMGGDVFDIFDTPTPEIGSDYADYIERSYEEGIRQAVAEKFQINKDEIGVSAVGLDTESLSAQRVTVYLRGSALLCDYRGVKKYVEEISSGECVVEIEVGG
jgi:hypothetical protein